jgi:hypothetical protein
MNGAKKLSGYRGTFVEWLNVMNALSPPATVEGLCRKMQQAISNESADHHQELKEVIEANDKMWLNTGEDMLLEPKALCLLGQLTSLARMNSFHCIGIPQCKIQCTPCRWQQMGEPLNFDREKNFKFIDEV